MCLSENEPGGPKRCDGHAEIGLSEARSKMTAILAEQGSISNQLQPIESQLLRARALAEHARANDNEKVYVRELARIENIEKVAEPLRDRAKKIVNTKGSQLQTLAEKGADFNATSTGLRSLQEQIDEHRIKARDESLPLPEREFSRIEAGRLQSIAEKSKIRMDAEEQYRLENARKHGWDYQVKDVVPISSYSAPREEPREPTGDHRDYYHAVDQFAADRGITMYAQGTVSDPESAEYEKYHVVIGNEEGKTVALDLSNYTQVPTRDPQDPLSSMQSAPSRAEVYMALNKRYAEQRAEPSFDKWIGGKGHLSSKDDPRYEEYKAQWQSSARERARLKKVLGDERFEKLATL